jgi:hypothetical protein
LGFIQVVIFIRNFAFRRNRLMKQSFAFARVVDADRSRQIKRIGTLFGRIVFDLGA